MRLHPCIAAVGLLLALAACRPGAAEYTAAEWPKTLRLDNVSTHLAVRFAPGSSWLAPRDAARLRRMAASGRIAPGDRVMVAAAGSPALAAARFHNIAAELLKYNVIANQETMAGIPPDRAILDTGRYLVTTPPCPNWSKEPTVRFTNTPSSNFGCATQIDLARIVWNPADLVAGRPLGPTDARTAVTAINNYREGKVQLPGAVTLGPIATPTAAPAGGGGGAGGATP